VRKLEEEEEKKALVLVVKGSGVKGTYAFRLPPTPLVMDTILREKKGKKGGRMEQH